MTTSGSGPRSGPLLLLDGMSLVFRSFFALPADLATASGVVTNAVHGFTSMLVLLVRDHRPSSLAVAFDPPGETFRDTMIEGYKAGRPATPDDLSPQFELVRQILAALAVPVVEVPGYEADDVLATLATEARDRQCPVIVVTGDRDCFQLVEDPYVRVLYNRRGVSDYALYDETGIVERTGVTPSLYPMLAALRGDPSDNLPGVNGVGEKTAAKLLNTYGDIDGIYANLAALTPKLRENLIEGEPLARSNALVIPLVRDVGMAVSLSDLTLGGWHLDTARRVFEDLELRTVWTRLEPLLADGSFGSPVAGSATPTRAALVPDELDGTPTGPAAGSSPEAPPPVAEQPSNAPDALVALAALGAADDGALAVAGHWVGAIGRSALSGLAVASGDPPTTAVWIDAARLAESEVLDALGSLWATRPVVGHQVKELFRSLLELGVACPELLMDTAVAAYLLDPSVGDYAIDAVAAPWLDRSALGERPTAAKGQLSLGIDAPAHDAEGAVGGASTAAQLVAPLFGALDAAGLRPLHDEVESPLVGVLARMEVVGIKVDTVELRRIVDELVEATNTLEAEIQDLAGHPFNVNSTPQLRTVLYDELGLTTGRKTKTGYSTDAQTLESLRDDHPIVETLLRYRELEKLRSTYGESLLAEVGADGRIHASFRQTVARTGRLSSERPNLHNIPVRTDAGRQFRRAFVPAEGNRLLVADYDQMELRVIAHLSGDPGLREAFRSGSDVHRTVAAGIYGLAEDEVTHTQRERAKMVSFGLAYGMEAFGLARRLATGVDEANEIMNRYFAAFPEVRLYMDTTVSEARARGYTRTALGRIRPLPELADRNYRVRLAAERQAMNAGIQGLAADLFKTALVRLDLALRDGDLTSRLVLQVHDEVLVDVAPGEDPVVEALVSDAMTGAAELSVPLKVSMAWGSSWAAAKGG
jgi:DNA polymerase I